MPTGAVVAPALAGVGAGRTGEVDHADGHPLVAAAFLHSRTHLRPDALRTDAEGVGSEGIAALAGLGLLNHLASPAFGGAGLPRAEDRRIHEHIAAGCLNTWLVWAQHAPLARRVEAALDGAPPQHELVDALLRGRAFAGAALSDVRRYPDQFVEATRAARGWRLSGTVSWVSGWGLNSAMLIAGVEPARELVVLALVPIGERFVAEALPLAALGGSRTARVRLVDVEVEDALVLAVEPLAEWREADRETAVDAKPHLFGFARFVLEELASEPNPAARDVAARWAPRVRDLRTEAYALADDPAASELFDERLAVRVDAGEALVTLARALLVARAGRSLERENSAQFAVRSAHFLLVQAQTDSVRAAQLGRLAPR